MEGVFINMFTWAWKWGGQAPAFSGLLHPGAGDQITTRQEKIKQRCRASARSLARPRDPGGWPADRRGGGEEEHLHHAPWVPARGQPMHFFQLPVGLVVPEGEPRGQVQHIELLLAAPTQAVTQEVLNQMPGTRCSWPRPTKICCPDRLA